MKRLLILLSCAVMLCGCTKSNIVKTGEPAVPEFDHKSDIVLDWGQIGDSMDEIFVESPEYPMAVSVNYSVDPQNKNIDLVLMVQPGTTAEDAVIFANAALRAINDQASTQDFNFEMSSENSYGGFFQTYSVQVQVLPDGTQENHDAWLVDMAVPAGSNEPIKAIEK